MREIYGGGSYLSQSDLRANFGLGQATRVESIEISWPSGQKQSFKDIESNKFYRIEEGRNELGLQQFTRSSKTATSPTVSPSPAARKSKD